MTDEPDPPPPPPPSPPPGAATTSTGPSRRAPLAMIIGVVVLAVLTVILLALVLTRDDGAATASESPTPSTSASASAGGSAPPSSSATAAATASADVPTQPDLAVDSVVATTVDNLTVRGAPGLGSERLGSLENGSLSFVAGGPTDADGFRWYLVSGLGLPPNSGCAGDLETDPYNCPIWFGWVAAASESGEPWLVEQDIACPEEPYTAENLALGRTALERLSCLGPDPFTFRGYWPEIPDDAGLGGACTSQDTPSGWLICQNTNYDTIVIDEDEDMFGVGLKVSIDPETDATMPERGTWVEVRAHLDDPAAQQCGEDAVGASAEERTPEQIVLACRSEAVLEEAKAVDGP
jgi:hypothetical protein